MKIIVTLFCLISLESSVNGQDSNSESKNSAVTGFHTEFNSSISAITGEVDYSLAIDKKEVVGESNPPRTIKQTYIDLDGNFKALEGRINNFLRTLTDYRSAVIHLQTTPVTPASPGGPYVLYQVLIEYSITVNE